MSSFLIAMMVTKAELVGVEWGRYTGEVYE